MSKITIVLIIAAIVCALFSDKIDEFVNGKKQVKKVIITVSVGVLLICTIAMIAGILFR